MVLALAYMSFEFARDVQQTAMPQRDTNEMAMVLAIQSNVPFRVRSNVVSAPPRPGNGEFGFGGPKARANGSKTSLPPIPLSVVGLLFPERSGPFVHYRWPMGNPVKMPMRGIRSEIPAEKLFLRAMKSVEQNTNDVRAVLTQMTIAYANSEGPLRGDILLEVNKWAKRMNEMARREIERFNLEMMLLLEDGRTAAAAKLWREFPKGLHVFRYELMIYDIVRTNTPQSHLPFNFGKEEQAEGNRPRFQSFGNPG